MSLRSFKATSLAQTFVYRISVLDQNQLGCIFTWGGKKGGGGVREKSLGNKVTPVQLTASNYAYMLYQFSLNTKLVKQIPSCRH